jgi:hypothetical protein
MSEDRMHRLGRSEAVVLLGLAFALSADSLARPDSSVAAAFTGAAPLDDIRDIAVSAGRVWVATQRGLAVYGRDDVQAVVP